VNRSDLLRLEAQLCFQLYTASRHVTQAYGPLLAPLGLTYPQYLVMLVLWEDEGAVSVGRLGQRLHLDSGTLTPLLKRLEAAGLVERARASHDERVVEVRLSAAGRRLRERAEGVPHAMFCRAGLTAASAQRLRDELRALLAAVAAAAPGGDGDQDRDHVRNDRKPQPRKRKEARP
jgi:MarR family transcriptional regulator, organic hydroperoxide resistance regulator